MKGLILAGGKGTRLYPTTKVVNKHLLLIYDKPMIFYAIETLRDAGITNIIISLSDDEPGHFMKLLGKGEELGVKLSYVIHGEPKGIAYGIWEAKHLLRGEPFVVYLGDNIFTESIKGHIDYFKKHKKPLVLLKKVDDPSRYGVVEFIKTNYGKRIKRFVEKPRDPPSKFIILGVYCLTDQFFKIYPKLKPSKRGEYEITDALNLLLPVGYTYYWGGWFDCGVFEDLYKASKWRREVVLSQHVKSV